MAAGVVAVDRVQVVVAVVEADQLAADQPGQDRGGVDGRVDRLEQVVDPDRGHRGGEYRQRLHHLLGRRVQQPVGLPDQLLDHLVFGQVPGPVQQIARGQRWVAVQDRLDRLQRPREAAGVLAQPVQQLVGGVAQAEVAVVVQLAQHGLGVLGAQALVQPQLPLARPARPSAARPGVTRVVAITDRGAPVPSAACVSASCSAGSARVSASVSITDSRLSSSTTTGSPGGNASNTASITAAGVLCGSWYIRSSRCASSRRQQPQQVRDQGRVLHLVHAVAAQIHDPAHRDRGQLAFDIRAAGRPPGP